MSANDQTYASSTCRPAGLGLPTSPDDRAIDVLASAIHDAKNQLFFAENLAAATAQKHGLDLDDMREAMERASSRLTRALLAYRLQAGTQVLSISAVAVHGLLEDAISICHPHAAHRSLTLEWRCDVPGVWPLDRDLILDVINNGLENAIRHAYTQVLLSAQRADDLLVIRIEDDGPGIVRPTPASGANARHGLGLHIGRQIVGMHRRHGKSGSLQLSNDGSLGGALLELHLP